MESPKASQSSLSSPSTSSSHCSSTGSCLWHLGPRDLYHGCIRGFSHAHRAPFLSCFGPRDIVRAAPEITLKSPEIAPEDFWCFCSRTCWGQRGQNQRSRRGYLVHSFRATLVPELLGLVCRFLLLQAQNPLQFQSSVMAASCKAYQRFLAWQPGSH